MATQVDSLFTTLSLRDRKFRAGMRGAMRAARRFGGVVSAISGGGLALLTVQAFKAADNLAKTADKLGVATEKLVGFRIAAERSGVDAKAFDVALQRLTRRTSEAAQGTGVAVKALAELGLNAQTIARLSPDEQLEKIADAFTGIGAQGDRVRLAFALFDTEGVALVNTLKNGASAFQQYVDFAERAGVATSRLDAAKIEAMNDSAADLKTVFQGIGNQLAIKVAPLLQVVFERLVNIGTAGGGVAEIVENALQGLLDIGARITDMFDLAIGGLQGIGGFLIGEAAKLVGVVDKTRGDALAAIAERALADASARIVDVGLNKNQTNVHAFFDTITAEANAAAAAALKTAEAVGAVPGAAATAKTGNFKQFSRALIDVRALSGSSEQKVRDPQLVETNRILAQVHDAMRIVGTGTGRGIFT